ncbi:MAG TPA: GNAT family N-acetyltransferase [Steroidobacteraceae bacterium]|nr:GNAT family N-acetyltransferase [Steroidobacteraceae bacterium]
MRSPSDAPWITVRSARPDDATRLAAFAARTFREAYAAQMPWDDVKAYCESSYNADRQAAEIADRTVATLLAEVDATLAGFVQLRSGEAPPCVEAQRSIELWRLYVDARWQGRGVAQALMSRAEETAKSRDAALLWLGVWERNARAQAFYGKCGFSKVGTLPFTLGRELQTDLVMVRALSAKA